jgi:hypothetical protein
MRAYFASLSKQMNAEIATIRQSLKHLGMKGAAAEEMARQFLGEMGSDLHFSHLTICGGFGHN